VRNTLLALDGVENVAVDFNAQTAYLTSADGSEVDAEAAIKALAAENYSATLKAEL
jgi:hypothetical protein